MATVPSFSLMPHWVTIRRAIWVLRWMSFSAPLVMSPKTISSAARPPRVIEHRVVELRPGGEEPVLLGQRDRVAERLAAADDRDLVDRVAVGQQVADDRVAELGGRR